MKTSKTVKKVMEYVRYACTDLCAAAMLGWAYNMHFENQKILFGVYAFIAVMTAIGNPDPKEVKRI